MAAFVLRRTGEPDLACSAHFPEEPARAGVLLIHGHGEHQGCYKHVVSAWLERGFAVAQYDLRGHGNSGGKPSHIAHFDDYLRDAHAVLGSMNGDPRWQNAGRPIVFGHSLGGLIAIQLTLADQATFRGLALSSPYLGLNVDVSPLLLGLGRALSKSWPTFTVKSPTQCKVLTHDLQKIAECEADPLRVSAVTARFFTEVERVQRLSLRDAKGFQTAVFCLAAGDDRVVSTPTTERWFAALGSADKELQIIPGAFHEVLNEVERVRHIAAFANRFERWVDPARQ